MSKDNKDKITPIMRQYLEIKATCPDKLLFYRMGDFYELFFDDAVTAAAILDITLTSRGKLGDEPVKMAGVPYHAAEPYIVKLIKAGKSVAICEQVGIPGADKGPIARKLVRTLTPGTLTDAALLADKETNRLLAVTGDKKKLGLAWLALASGEFRTKEIVPQFLEDELERIQAAEILLPDNKVITIPRRFQERITYINDWHFDTDAAFNLLTIFFEVQDLLAFGLDKKTQATAIGAAGALLNYVKLTQQTAPKHIEGPLYEQDRDFLGLDAATRRNLELTRTLSGKRAPTLLSVLDDCATNMGSRLLQSWIDQPLQQPARIKARQEAITELMTLDKGKLYGQLKSLVDIERINARIALGSVRPRDLAGLRATLEIVSCIVIKDKPKSSLLAIIQETFAPAASAAELLSAALAALPAVWLKDGGVIKDGFDADLDEYRRLQNDVEGVLAAIAAEERDKSGLQSLKIAYNRIQGFYLELSRKDAVYAPADYQRTQTLKNAERFITVRLKELEAQVLNAQNDALRREKELFDKLLVALQSNLRQLGRLAQGVAFLDVLDTLARLAVDNNYVCPQFTAEPGMAVHQGRHPVVASLIKPFAANDCILDSAQKIMLITGPNMGGKSTYMRQNALIIIMAYMGSLVPAQKVILGPIDKIFTRIGAADDIAGNRSTFMVEMSETAYILRQATPCSLVLMDEVGRGTANLDGAAIAEAVLFYLAGECASFTLFATHYFELTALPQRFPVMFNQHLSAVEENSHLVFLHKLQPGAAFKSYGVAVAKLAGLPPKVIRLAEKILSRQEQAVAANKLQPDLFMPPVTAASEPDYYEFFEKYEALCRRISAIDPDGLTPREALSRLYELIAAVSGES